MGSAGQAPIFGGIGLLRMHVVVLPGTGAKVAAWEQDAARPMPNWKAALMLAPGAPRCRARCATKSYPAAARRYAEGSPVAYMVARMGDQWGSGTVPTVLAAKLLKRRQKGGPLASCYKIYGVHRCG